MSTFAFIAQGFGRVVNAFRITLITGYIMLFFAPSFLTDLSFLLSFATTLSLIFLTDKFNSLFGFVPGIFRDDVSTSLAAFLGSSPIIFYFFGNISLIGPFINVLVLWTVVPIMMIGGIGALLSFIFPHLGKLLLQAVLPLTSWFLAVINF
jgi:predicted membrane metal-binding protein